MNNIPIYRAKTAYNDEYVEGYYILEPETEHMKELHFLIDLGHCRIHHEVDPSTLSIHFPDMLDSEGNKIFASLQEDGKGGDVITHYMDLENEKFPIIFKRGGTRRYFPFGKSYPIMNKYNEYTVTGVQK